LRNLHTVLQNVCIYLNSHLEHERDPSSPDHHQHFYLLSFDNSHSTWREVGIGIGIWGGDFAFSQWLVKLNICMSWLRNMYIDRFITYFSNKFFCVLVFILPLRFLYYLFCWWVLLCNAEELTWALCMIGNGSTS
jgi:hypothetical protein